MDSQTEAKNKQDVMVSNLPLLFSNGKPTSLSSMDAQDLQYFIPFLVKCILGCEPSGWAKYPKFKWWPDDVPWSPIILTTKHQTSNWRNKLESVVKRCYEHNGCSYLLQFSARLEQLSGFKFEDNWDGTTSMYDTTSGKLLVTFRNENMNYDKSFRQQDAASRPTLLPRLNSPTSPTKLGVGTPNPNVALQAPPIAKMVEPPATDQYLCDYCGADFSSLRAIKNHEVKCMAEKASEVQSNINTALEEDTEQLDEAKFLWYLRLLGRNEKGPPPNATPAKVYPARYRKPCMLIAKRFTTIPFSSNLGQSFFKTRDIGLTQAELLVSRYERLCIPKPAVTSLEQTAQSNVASSAASSRPRSANLKRKDEWAHTYSFTKADRKERILTIATGLDKRARMLLRKCAPVRVVLHRLSDDEIEKWTRPKPKRVQSLIQPWLQKSIANLPSSCTVSLAPADSPHAWFRKKPMAPQIVVTRPESANQSNARSQTVKKLNEPPALLPLITNAWSMQTMQSVKPRPVNNQFVLPDLIPVVNRQPKIRSPEPVIINMPSLQKPKAVIDTPSVTITPSSRGVELVDLCSSEDESDDELGTVINTGVDKPLVLPPGISVTKIDRTPPVTSRPRAKSLNLSKSTEHNNNRSKRPVHTSTPMLPKGPPPSLKFMGQSSVQVKRELMSENPTFYISDDLSLQTVTPIRIGKMPAAKREQMKQSLQKIKKKEAKTSPVGPEKTATKTSAQSVKENQASPTCAAPSHAKNPSKGADDVSLEDSQRDPKRSGQSKILNSNQPLIGRKRSAEMDHESEESGDIGVGPPTKKVPKLDVADLSEKNPSPNQPSGETCPPFVEADASSSHAETRASSRLSCLGPPEVRGGRKWKELSQLLSDECKELRRKGLESLPTVEVPNQRITRCRTKSLPSVSNKL